MQTNFSKLKKIKLKLFNICESNFYFKPEMGIFKIHWSSCKIIITGLRIEPNLYHSRTFHFFEFPKTQCSSIGSYPDRIYFINILSVLNILQISCKFIIYDHLNFINFKSIKYDPRLYFCLQWNWNIEWVDVCSSVLQLRRLLS